MDETTRDAWTGKKNELSPEALEKRKGINKKIFKFGCLPIAILFILIVVIASQKDEKTIETSNYISGLSPADVYLIFEKRGFKTEKQLGGEGGNLWTTMRRYEGMQCKVEIFSSDTSNVESVRATAIIDLKTKKIIAANPFIRFMATLPYDSANMKETANWIDENFNNNKASTVIGDVKFTIYVPSDSHRSLLMEKAIKAEKVTEKQVTKQWSEMTYEERDSLLNEAIEKRKFANDTDIEFAMREAIKKEVRNPKTLSFEWRPSVYNGSAAVVEADSGWIFVHFKCHAKNDFGIEKEIMGTIMFEYIPEYNSLGVHKWNMEQSN